LDDFVVHGWQRRAGKLVQDRRRYEKNKNGRNSGGKRRKSAEKPLKSSDTVPNQTVPNLTLPNQTLKEVSVNGADTTPQAIFVKGFKDSYEAMTQQPFKAGQEHYVIAARLIKAHGLNAVVSKAKTLGVLCRDGSAWFTKDGWGSFTIETLSKHWNSILEDARPDPEAIKERDFLRQLKKAEETI